MNATVDPTVQSDECDQVPFIATTVISVGMLVLEQILAKSSCKHNSTMEVVFAIFKQLAPRRKDVEAQPPPPPSARPQPPPPSDLVVL